MTEKLNGLEGLSRMSGLGDIVENALLKRIFSQQQHLGHSRWIVKPEWQPKAIPGLENIQDLIEHHLLHRLWELFQDNYQLLQRGTYRIQKPGWIEPPITSQPEDRVSETPVPLVNGTAVTIVSYTVPDSHYAVFKWFGHMLDVSSQWGVVSWTIQINKKPYRTYQGFLQQRGTIIQPTPIARPITLNPRDLLEVTATGGVTAVNAFARIEGWSIAAASVVQDGSNKGFDVR